MEQGDKLKPKRRELKRSDNAIPDYEHLFDETITKSGKKKGFFGKLLRMNYKRIILATLIYFLQALPVWFVPLLTADIINVVTAALSTGVGATAEVWRRLIIDSVLIIVLLVQNCPSSILRNFVVSKMVRRQSAGIKSAVVRKLQSLSITYHKDMQSGKVQAKFLKDTEAVDSLFNIVIGGIIPTIISIIVSLVIAISKNWIVAIFFAMLVPCNILLTSVFRKKMGKIYKDYRVKTEDLSNKMNTMLEMMPVTKAHGLEEKEISSFNKTISRLASSGINLDKTNARFGMWTWVIPAIMSSTCLIVCAIFALHGMISVGDIVLYQSLFSSVTGSVMAIISYIPSIASGADAVSSISEIMNTNDIEVHLSSGYIPRINGDIEFKNLSYKYPNTEQYVVSDLNLKVKSGECIAVVGSSGSGKSTMMNLIIGFLMPDKGDLIIDGKSIRDVNLSEYRHNISVVSQNNILFDGTIKDNITYGLDFYSDEQLEKAIEMANLKDFISELPNGVNTRVGEHGAKLSGGQKQRITIARALIRNPRLLILDEATSALDNISEYHVQKAIASSIKGRTTFIVAHRLSTIRNADRIVVMEQGKAVEIGTYDELMAKQGKFFELKALNEMNLKEAAEGLEA